MISKVLALLWYAYGAACMFGFLVVQLIASVR